MGTRKNDKHQLLTQTYTNQTTSWLVRSLNASGVRMSHGQIRIHKIHHGLNLGEATTFPPYSILCAWPQHQLPNVILSQESHLIPKVGTLATLGAYNFV